MTLPKPRRGLSRPAQTRRSTRARGISMRKHAHVHNTPTRDTHSHIANRARRRACTYSSRGWSRRRRRRRRLPWPPDPDGSRRRPSTRRPPCSGRWARGRARLRAGYGVGAEAPGGGCAGLDGRGDAAFDIDSGGRDHVGQEPPLAGQRAPRPAPQSNMQGLHRKTAPNAPSEAATFSTSAYARLAARRDVVAPRSGGRAASANCAPNTSSSHARVGRSLSTIPPARRVAARRAT
jgi:hypothetical protein